MIPGRDIRWFVFLFAPLCLAALVLLAACASPSGTSNLPTPTHTPDATSLPAVFFVRQKQDPNVYMQALVEGELELADGCLRIGGADGHVPIWPWDFALEANDGGVQVVDAGGRIIAQIGDKLRLSGGEAPAAPLVEDAARPLLANCPGPYWIVGNEIERVALMASPTPSEPRASSTPEPSRATASPAPTVTPSSSPTPVDLELSVATYPLVKLSAPESDVLDFAASVEGDPLAHHAAERAQHFPDPTCYVAGNNGYCAKSGANQYGAWGDHTDPEAVYVVVTRDERQVSKIPVGAIGTIPSLWGIWAYNGHWAVETALVDTAQSGNLFTSTATGQVVVDGVSLNDELGYDETFSFQTLGGKPFYFFERHGVVDANYDGVDVPLGFDEVPHLHCCSAAAFNPEAHPNVVTFYGRKGDAWYYGEIAVVLVTLDQMPTPRAKSSDSTPTATPRMPQVLSAGVLDCTPAGTYSHCVDDVLGIEFEVPASWGEPETGLRPGLDAGLAYDYSFDREMHAETEAVVAGGRSIDFSEGRGAMPTDFSGYAHAGWQRTSACAGADDWFSNSYPVCSGVSEHVAWMIRFPNADVLCADVLGNWTTVPVFRIEIDLPDNPTINGFVFEAPFFSEQFADQVKDELYPLIGARSGSEARRCDEASRQAFDAQLAALIEGILDRTADGETLEKVDELVHLAESIVVRER